MRFVTVTQNPRWEIIEPQTESPPARSGHCAAVYDGKIYIFGGADADYFYNDIWCFDTRALTWTPIPASGYLPTGRHGHSCTLVDGVLYIFGGNSPDGSELNDAYAFRIHGMYQVLLRMYHHASWLAPGQFRPCIYTFTNNFITPPSLLFIERRWYLFQNVGPAPSPRSGHTMCTVKDKIFILGGESEQNRMEDSAQIYFVEIRKFRWDFRARNLISAYHVSRMTRRLILYSSLPWCSTWCCVTQISQDPVPGLCSTARSAPGLVCKARA